MSDLVKRLRASVKMDAHNGDAVERSICGKQMLEAANRIEGLEQDLADYKEGTEGMRLSIGDLRRERDELGQIVADLRRQLAEAKTEAYDEYESAFLDFIDDDLSSMVDIDKWPKAIRSLLPPKGGINIPPLYDLNAIAKSHRKGDHR